MRGILQKPLGRVIKPSYINHRISWCRHDIYVAPTTGFGPDFFLKASSAMNCCDIKKNNGLPTISHGP